METRANYALIGVFTLAVVAAAFGFVLWFSGAEKSGGRTPYKIVFSGSVSGLSVGGVVLFNGVRVGAVKKIDLLPQDPSRVVALVDVDANVPVRTDTKARLEYTGLTGVASVALTGGALEAPPLPTSPQQPGVIVADSSEFQDLIATARRVAAQASDFFTKSNRLIDDNSASITASVKNVEKFSGALAANSDDIKDFMGTIKPLSEKLDALAGDADKVVKAINPDEVKTIVTHVASLSAKFDKIATGIDRFSVNGLRQYEALAADGRKTLEQINQAVRSLDKNPQQFLFGKSPQIPEYSGAR
ncbi:MAG TPA: MlaD family protein [Methylocella sp.]|jgi:phospholipid/cholesterol/gamma-HCH transport system substrate-binding protein